MAHGADGQRKTKGDLKRKRINRGYKRGGKFRTHNLREESFEEKFDKIPTKKSKNKSSKK